MRMPSLSVGVASRLETQRDGLSMLSPSLEGGLWLLWLSLLRHSRKGR